MNAAPTPPSAEAECFYVEAMQALQRFNIPHLVAGTYAVSAYTGIVRPTKDLDIFCKPGDSVRILERFKTLGYRIQVEDERWLGKVSKGEHYFDLIFASRHGAMPIDDDWFEHAPVGEVLGVSTRLIAPTELIWSKAFVQVRHRYDGADIANVILRRHDQIDWKRLLRHMDLHWEILLMHVINFRWVYPSERNFVPRWLMDELVERLHRQLELPSPRVKICRGRMLSQSDYEIAVRDWGFGEIDDVVNCEE